MKILKYYLPAALLAGFGMLTLFLSTSVIFDLFGIREREGNYVPFVVWANFISSVIYLFAAFAYANGKGWTPKLLGVSFVILVLAIGGLFLHINSGGLYETKTIGAMVFRITITGILMLTAYFTMKNQKI